MQCLLGCAVENQGPMGVTKKRNCLGLPLVHHIVFLLDTMWSALTQEERWQSVQRSLGTDTVVDVAVVNNPGQGPPSPTLMLNGKEQRNLSAKFWHISVMYCLLHFL